MLKIKIVPTQLLGYADGGMSQGLLISHCS